MNKSFHPFHPATFRILLAASFILLSSCGRNIGPSREEAQGIYYALKWGNLAPIPGIASDTEVEIKGGEFSRQYVVSFTCDPGRIHVWEGHSEGLKGLTPSDLGGGKRRYKINPGYEGAIGGTVTIEGDRVVIDMSWS